jgi:hypothetical protein
VAAWLASSFLAGCSSGSSGNASQDSGTDAPGLVLPPPGIVFPDAAKDTGKTTPGMDGGGGTDAGTDSGKGASLPDAQPALPQVITFGGPTLTTPKVQPIAFMDDADLTSMTGFLTELSTISYWSDTTSEYGVGPLTILPVVYLAATSPATFDDAQMTSAISANTTGTSPAWGPTDPSTIYLFLFTHATTVSSNGNGCTDFDGYHDETSVNGVSVPYAVSCSCPGFDGPGITNVQERTVNISHELVETATDPLPNSNTAYGQEDNADIIWTLISGGEVADMCEFNDDTYVVPPGGTYVYQRSWSNVAAKADQSPCVPHTQGTPFFDVYARTTAQTIELGGPPTQTQGIKIPVGQTLTIPLTLWQAAPMPGPWTVRVYDGNYLTTGSAELGLTLQQGTSSGCAGANPTVCTGVAGDVMELTIDVMTADPANGGESFVIFADYPNPGSASVSSNMTIVLITN